MCRVGTQYKWIVEEYILRFFRCYMVPFPVFCGVGLVPVEARTIRKRVNFAHIMYISHIYHIDEALARPKLCHEARYFKGDSVILSEAPSLRPVKLS